MHFPLKSKPHLRWSVRRIFAGKICVWKVVNEFSRVRSKLKIQLKVIIMLFAGKYFLLLSRAEQHKVGVQEGWLWRWWWRWRWGFQEKPTNIIIVCTYMSSIEEMFTWQMVASGWSWWCGECVFCACLSLYFHVQVKLPPSNCEKTKYIMKNSTYNMYDNLLRSFVFLDFSSEHIKKNSC